MIHTVTIVMPALNEEAYIAAALASVRAFSVPLDWKILEALVVDGGSTDETKSIVSDAALLDPRIVLLDNPKRIQSAALNMAIDRIKSDYLMRLDAHAVYPADYLERCIAAATSTGADNVGGICVTMPGGRSYGAAVVQALTSHKFGVGNSGFRTGAAAGPSDTVPYGFFCAKIFRKIGKYDERLVRAQDYEFNRRILVAGGKIWLDPAIMVTYYNQPGFLPFLLKQTLREAPYNFYMWYLAPYTFACRHAITAFFALGVVSGVLLWPFTTARVAYTVVTVTYVLLATFSAIQQAVKYKEMRHVVCLPVTFFLYHFLHGLGVIAGGLRLLTGTAPVQKMPEPWPGAGRLRAWPVRVGVRE